MTRQVSIRHYEQRVGWTPLLNTSVAAVARTAIRDIANALAERDANATDASDLCDRALFFAYLSREEEFGDWEEPAINSLNVAVEKAVAGAFPHPGLFGGLCALGWTIQHVSDLLGAHRTKRAAEDPLEDVDAHVIRALRHYPDGAPYDLISGLVGIGVYFLERLPTERAREGLSLILQLLDASSEWSWGGRTWRTPPEGLPDEQRAVCPNGHYNLGVAHGVPGVVYLLAEMAVTDVERDKALRLLNPTIDWIFARRLPPSAATRFSSWFVPGAAPTDSRLGWCYGDFGIAAVLEHVAVRLARGDVGLCSQDLLERSSRRTPQDGGIHDMGMCHGALGLAHVYNRLFQAGGSARYKAAAVDWYERALAMRRTGEGIAGFFSWRPDNDPPIIADASMLSGAAGCALSLLAATSFIPPAWDRRLLLSGRSPANAPAE